MGATKQFQYVLTVRSEVRFVPELLLLEMKCLNVLGIRIVRGDLSVMWMGEIS
ncbi:BnaC03g29700D [Brassica napus]|uniref:(rape) hypothetical protein n=1 Tax=Brassica napus TaxID=3708 RepID=A0A078G793_BRANA|nr:unnamed protein product [Brassica napus]CDY21286.1 BnaC03g29700D [Brassica napus]